MFCRWADRQSAEGRDGNVHSFDHPFLQVKESRFDACSFFMITTFSLEKICFIAHIKLPVHIFVPKIRAVKLKWSFYEFFFLVCFKKIYHYVFCSLTVYLFRQLACFWGNFPAS